MLSTLFPLPGVLVDPVDSVRLGPGGLAPAVLGGGGRGGLQQDLDTVHEVNNLIRKDVKSKKYILAADLSPPLGRSPAENKQIDKTM